MAALNAAADFCEGGGCCRRARFATLFRQPLAPRGTTALPHARCCDGCTALAERRGRDDVGRDVVGADGQIHGSVRDVGEVAVEALRVLGGLNGAAAAAGVTDGGMAPAKLTAVKLCDKLGSKARGVAAAAAAAVAVVVVVVVVPVVVPALVPHYYYVLPGAARRGQAGARRAGAHRAAAGACGCRPYPLCLHRVHGTCAPTCTCTLPLHSSPTSPLLSHLQVLTYLYVRPSLASVLESTPASTADDLHLPPLSRTLDAALLPSPKAAKARPTLTLTTDPSPSPRPNPYLGH